MNAVLPAPAGARALLLAVALLALVTYAGAPGNGWAFDDDLAITGNPVVTEGRWIEALTGPYRHPPDEPPALYRPTTSAFFTLQWALFGDRPAAFHAVGVALHAFASVLVALLLARVLPPVAAAAGGALFAVHPVHVEAVANVVGQAELLAAVPYLAAGLLYLGGREGPPGIRALRLTGLLALYAVAVGAKEIAVTLPAVLVLLELAAPRAGVRSTGSIPRRVGRAISAEAPLHLGLAAVLLAFLAARVWILGFVRGDLVAPELHGLSWSDRALTAVSVFPTILRLLAFPLELAADYGPGVLEPATGLRADVVLGGALLVGTLAVAGAGWSRAPAVAFAAAWLLVTLLPVSNVIVPAGILLAERTLYLPSVAAAAAGAALLARVTEHPAWSRRGWALAGVATLLFTVRSVERVPTWSSSFTVMNTLAREHPDSWRALRSRGLGLVRAGELEAARMELEAALTRLPAHYGLLCEAAVVNARLERWARARALLDQAIALDPDRPVAYRLLAETLLLEGNAPGARTAALRGLARWGPDRALWALVSETHAARGDLTGAIRARQAALGADPTSRADRARLAELVEADHAAPRAEVR